ncbi:MAG: aldo/keto reductase [Chloroflexi bacterium]|nr:aldo/keto reductase [Chloroflexota bacterium]
MQYRRFGRTNLQVSAMGFGTWPMSGDRYGAIEIDEAVKAIQAAIDAGVNCVDTAPAYGAGHSETAVARALKGRRDKVILVTKCGINRRPDQATASRDSSRANILAEVDISLKRLEVDYLDVYLIHWPDQTVPYDEAFAAMDEVVKSGKVRFVGVSNFTVDQMKECMKARPIDVIQVGYHLFDRRMEKEIFPFCAENDIGVMGYGSLAHGLLTGTFSADMTFDALDWRGGGVYFGQPILKGKNLGINVDVVNRIKAEIADPRGVPLTQIALAWVLRNPVLSTALVGSRNSAELASNLAGTELTLSDDEVARIEEIMKGAAGMHDIFTPLRQAMEEWGPIAEPQPAT